ncbi:copper amine oxidase N-terminal domain-containing protein [Paenibacillus sp. Soil724D2]|uniref:copper amine oxidase N-terminal domain-containing protein n=1 Tax=Paenibacillus sp. (strain Soil724D2) TaxID=1736392 RepID=UPI000715A939|nr:copper amine oxidase N-terminal domain-containing protein [Paenibacillus sp. Soil724D2]KRE51398.1 copper amine oxidase [Paenibacillus sp. Soil724D2]
MNRTMKKSLAILSLSTMMTTGAAFAATNETVHTTTIMPVTTQATPTAISVQVNEGALSEKGYLKAAATEPMLPLRAVTESLGFKLTWNQETLSVDLLKGSVFTTVKTGEDRYAINKMFTTLGTAPELVDNKLYVPASFVSKVLHGSVTTKGASVSIAMKKDVKKVQTTGVITSIRPVDDYTAIQIQGIGTEGMILNVNKDTEYQMLDGTKLSLSDLHVGLTVTAEHSMATTLSLPPQTSTSKITVLDTKREANSLGTAGVVEEVRGDDKGNMSLLVKGTGLTETSPSEVVLQISDKTAIVDKNGDKVEKAALVKGANVIGFYGPALTKSLPPIGQAWKIVVSAKQE